MIWIVSAFSLLFLYYCFYNFRTAFFFRRLMKKSKANVSSDLPFVSVIVAARNEEFHIARLITCLREQDYPASSWEFILVNDHSEDETAEQAAFFSRGIPHSHLLSLPEGKTGKKAAIEYGISTARGEIILCTDADCISGKKWISSMAAQFTMDTGAVSGPVRLHAGSGIFSSLQALEFMGLIATGSAAIESGNPSLANGANFAYRKKVFLEVDGFNGNATLPSGDDEFLLHKIHATGKYKIRFAAQKEAIVSTDPQPDLNSFSNQRIRWVSKSLAYTKKSISLSLSVIWLGMWLFPLLTVLCVFDSDWSVWLASIFTLKLLSEFLVLASAAGFFDNFGLLVWLIPESILHIVYVIWVGVAGNTSAFTWKKENIHGRDERNSIPDIRLTLFC